MQVLQVLVLILQILLGVVVGYLLLLTLASQRAGRKTLLPGAGPACRFLIIIPAHNEERLLPETLDNLAALDYPQSLYTVHVIADNCTDRTAEVAASRGVRVHVREDRSLVGKGYALQWLLRKLWADATPHDALVFIDADSILSPNFLRVMAAKIERGEKVIQAYYAVRAPETSWNGSLRYAALALIHYLRPQGRMVLGGSVGLKGNGMVFAAGVMHRYQWSASLTEDIELHMALVLSGQRVTFAPDAVVWGEMPNSLAQMQSQHTRWERGRLDMARAYVGPLLDLGLRDLRAGRWQMAFMRFDAAMEHLIPPFSLFAGLSGLFVVVNAVFFALSFFLAAGSAPGWLALNRDLGLANLIFSVALILGQAIYTVSGLRQVQAPAYVYTRLLYAPLLIGWKIKHYWLVLRSKGQPGWVRTTRNEETPAGH